MKNVMEYSLKELQDMEAFKPESPFRSVVIVPTDAVHDSGFACMKFVLCDEYTKIVGVVDTGSDVIWPNGIGGHGRKAKEENMMRKVVPYTGLHIDCLPKSHCVRLILDYECRLDDFIGSDFIFYTIQKEDFDKCSKK